MVEEETAIIAQEQPNLPLVDVDSAVAYWQNYQELTERLLDESDYLIQGKTKFKKKSAWRKYATFMGISTEIVNEEITRDEQGRVVTAKYEVRATAKNGRSETGIGVCSIWDKAHEHNKTFKNGECKGPCDGRKHYDKPEHDIPSTAHTRAKNRAISDLIGAGEVSAEEVSSVRESQRKSRGVRSRGERPKSSERTQAPPADPEDYEQSGSNVPPSVDPSKVKDAETTTKPRPKRTRPARELLEDEITLLKNKNENLKKAINVLNEDSCDITKSAIITVLENMLGDKALPDFDLDAFKQCKKDMGIN